MWYILIMNKNVIYIEPEDDITDIITKIEKSKEKIVALVPPKKAGVFRSVVNIKLISKVGKTSEKTVVLVTTDPSIIKLAAATKIPVTKDLQTSPAVPTADMEVEETTEEEIIEEPEEEVEEESETEDEKEEEEAEEETEEKEGEEKPKKKKKADKKQKEKKESNNPIIAWIQAHKKVVTFGGLAFLILLIFLIWAFGVAPAATLDIEIQTESKSFAENVSFTTNAADENAKEGKFYFQEKKTETVQEIKFEATGQKNIGEKASGEVQVYAYFPLNNSGNTPISEGTNFTISGLVFKASENVVISYSGQGKSECANKDNSEELVDYGCRINGVVPVIASESGSKYNIAASSTGWDTVARVFAYSVSEMSGGTDNVITVVEQADIEKAKDQLKSSSEEEMKNKLYSGIGDNMMIIESSFKQETSTAESTPAAGEEVKEGETPVLKATTTATVYAIDKSKMEEFISDKADVKDDQKIYEIKDPFIENLSGSGAEYTGRLKTNYTIGPKITNSDILEMTKGKGMGDAQHDLKNINGIVDVHIYPSYPWVNTIPGDSNKITINIEIKTKEKKSEP